MGKFEFIIALTEHRLLGKIFQPFFIIRREKFYTVIRLVRPHDFDSGEYKFRPFEKKLVELIEKYSDEKLFKRFSRASNVSDFYASMSGSVFEKQVVPFVEECLTKVAGILMLSPLRLFKKEAKYANLYEEDLISVPSLYARPEFHFERTETHTRYQLKVYLDEQEIPLRQKNSTIVASKPCLLLARDQLIAFEKMNAKKLMPFFEKEAITVPNTIEDKYYSGFILNTVREYEVRAEGFEIIESPAQKRAILSLEKDLQLRPSFVLRFKYGPESFTANSNQKVSVTLAKQNGSFVFYKTRRDLSWEKKIVEELAGYGLEKQQGLYTLPGSELFEPNDLLYQLVGWLNKNRIGLEERDIYVEQKELEKSYFTGEQAIELKTTDKGDWFDVFAMVRFGEYSFPFIKLKKYILNNIREFELPNGEVAILPEEWFVRYKGILPFGKQTGKNIRFEKHHYSLLQHSLQEADRSLFSRFEELSQGEKHLEKLPGGLRATLRGYQETGFNWMYGLYRNNLGGCLADDMGLGKTLQTLTLLLKLKKLKRKSFHGNPSEPDLFSSVEKEERTIQNASLIVVPTSLVHNWEREIQKFTPSLKIYKYVGIQRKKVVDPIKIASYYDIILTTYGTVRNDSELLSGIPFFYLILDESQAIKNPSSKSYKSVMKIRSAHKLVITGTPIENSLSDLWTQMNFINPGLLGSLAYFRKAFITPIEKHGNDEQREKLKLIIRPFVLRRKKEEVEKDLPPIMEEIRICPMTEDQRKKYEEEKSIIRNSILSAIEQEGLSGSGFFILQGLTRLRQMANHPALVDFDDHRSGKFEEIFRMLQNLMAENHKVLIFSSFVRHLELVETGLVREGWKYSKLTGQTVKRSEVIEQFQSDGNNRIFLISLKAGGVGLNLTEADYVFILDPWWNPASENQAISRAHRIGQDKHVFVYRFITENSIEEKIQKLQKKKSVLADRFINSNNPFQQITREEISELFS